jgi:hypothetical protein
MMRVFLKTVVAIASVVVGVPALAIGSFWL